MADFKDKINIKDKIGRPEPLILTLGGGPKKTAGRINIDILDLPETDIVTDMENGLPFLPDSCVDEIHAHSFFEHIRNFGFLMEEMHRVLKPNGQIFAFVPHWSNPYYYSDYTHKTFFGYYTFYYFSKNQKKITRKVPNFYTDLNFEVVSQKMLFTSRFNKVRVMKQWIGKFINRRIKYQELYEELLSPIFPCYGLEVTLRAIKDHISNGG